MPAWLVEEAAAVRLICKVKPGAARDAIVRLDPNCIQVQVRAPAVDNKANRALVAYLAAVLDLPKGRFTLVRGQSTRMKTVRVAGADPAVVLKQLTTSVAS